MAKRFTDSEKWNKSWFRKLKPENKCFWIYILDKCSNAGIWDVDFEAAEFFIGTSLNRKEIDEIFKKQFIEIADNKWFIHDFIEWQYNCKIENLNEKNKAHLSVIRILSIYDIKGLTRGIQPSSKGLRSKSKTRSSINIKDYSLRFESFWKLYPRKIAKGEAFKKWLSFEVEKNGFYGKIIESLSLQLPTMIRKELIYIPYPATWLNQRRWEDDLISLDESNILPNTEKMNLSEFIGICRSNENRHINIIGEYADEIKPTFSTADQWREFIKSNSEFSKRLSPFDDDQLSNAMRQVKSAGYLEKYTLETLHKFLVK